MENFVLYEEIGTADGQIIYKARRKGTIIFLAISCIDKKKRAYVTNHVRFVHAVKHKYILRFHEWYETSNHLWVVMDLCTGGTMERMLREDKHFPEVAISELGRQLIEGLHFIQSSGFIFGDWCPRRIFLDGCGNVKYYDFSYARMENENALDIFKDSIESESNFDGLSSSSLAFIAPEILAGEKATKASDVWSLGCIFFKMFFGCTPFVSQISTHLIQSILTHDLVIPHDSSRQPSPEFWELLCAMLTKDPSHRINLTTVSKHSFWIDKEEKKRSACATGKENIDLEDDQTSETISISESISSNLSTVSTKQKVSSFNRLDEIQLRNERRNNLNGNIKRTVPMGAQLPASKTNPQQQQPKHQPAMKPLSNTLQPANTAAPTTPIVKKSATPINYPASTAKKSPISKRLYVPSGVANFTLHAQACPVTLRQQRNDNGINNNANSKKKNTAATTNDAKNRRSSLKNQSSDSNDDSLETSIHSTSTVTRYDSRRDSKISIISETSTTNIFKLEDSLDSPGARMTKSEYVFRDSDEAARVATKFNRSSESTLVSPQARSRLALIYPWGDDTIVLPRETRLNRKQDDRRLESLFKYELEDELDNEQIPREEIDGGVGVGGGGRSQRVSPSWIPQPLGDYSKWTRNPPAALLRGDLKFSQDLQPIAPENLEQMTLEEIDEHSKNLLLLLSNTTDNTMTTSVTSSVKTRSANHLGYVAWFLSATTLTHTKGDSKKPLFEAKLRCSINRTSEFLCEALYQLKSPNTPETRTWLCRIISLLAYRSSFILQYYRDDPNRREVLNTLVNEIAPQVTNGMITIVDLLREPGSRSVFNLRQAAVTALGELLVCEICLLGDLINAPTGLDLTSLKLNHNQWQTIVFQLIRCLAIANPSSRNSTATNASSNRQVSSIAVFCTTPTAKSRNEDKSGSDTSSGSSMSMHLTEEHVRLAAARSLDESIIAIIGCKLHWKTQSIAISNADEGNESILLASVYAFLDCLLTPENVSRIWADGVIGGLSSADSRPSTHAKQLVIQRVALSSASSLAGVIRLRPALLTGGLIDRNGASAFLQKFNPSTTSKEPQQTDLMAHLLAATATGLLLPLSFCSKSTSSSYLRIGIKSGTPVACRRLVSSQRFIAALTRHFESPHVMLRAKAYLLTASALDTNPGETLVQACESRLPSCLERDLRMTNQHYTPATAEETDGVLVRDDASVNSHHSVAISPGLQYLGICVRHISDFVVYSLIPNICKQVAISIGVIPAPVRLQNQKPANTMTTSTIQLRSSSKRGVSSADAMRRNSGQSTTTGSSGVSLRTWLPAYSCIPIILSSSASIRNSLLLPSVLSTSDSSDEFCLLAFLGMIIEHWSSNDPITAAAGLSGVHHAGSLEHQLLGVTLALTEDLSRLTEVVEGRRADLIKFILPALARLAIAPASEPITRTICVKIIVDMKNTWLGDTDSLNFSNASLKTEGSRFSYPAIPSLENLNPSTPNRVGSMRGVSGSSSGNRSTCGSTISRTSNKSRRTPAYRPISAFGKISSGMGSNVRSYHVAPTPKGLQGPSPEVLLGVVEMVNNLLIPYASRLLDPHEPMTASFFFRLVLDCLQHLNQNNSSSPPASVFSQSSTSSGYHSPSPTQPINKSVNTSDSLVLSWHAAGLHSHLLFFLTHHQVKQSSSNLESSPRNQKSVDGSRIPNIMSTQCLLALNIFTFMLTRWPKQAGIVELICNKSKNDQKLPTKSLAEITGNIVVTLGGLILRQGRRQLTSSPNLRRRSNNTVTSNIPIILRVSDQTQGIQHLLIALDLLNIQLNFIADIVRLALHAKKPANEMARRHQPTSARSTLLSARSTNRQESGEIGYDNDGMDYGVGVIDCLPTDEAGSVCVVAEQMLAAARPPSHLPGILASLLEACADTSKPFTEISNHYPSSSSTPSVVIKTEAVSPLSPANLLVESATSALASLASLYGGEYCRTALSAAGLRGFATALGQGCRCDASLSVEERRSVRLLLRILCRLSESDSGCAQRMVGPAAKQLHTALNRLKATAGSSDSVTSRLADALLEKLHKIPVLMADC